MNVYPIARLTLLPLIRLFIRDARGFENLPARGPFILACKHQAVLDGVFVAAAIIPKLNEKIHFIARIAKWGWFWEKVVAERWAANIPYYDENPRLCLEIARHHLEQGRIVGIFPEGVLEEYEEYERIKGYRGRTGVARLALWAGAPVVPVGLYNIRTGSRQRVILHTLLHPNTVRIRIGKPIALPKIEPHEITHERLREVTDAIMMEINRLTPKL